MQDIENHLLTMTQSYNHSHAITYFQISILTAWRKWRNLNSVITISGGMLNVRIGKCKQTTVFDNDTVKLLLEDIFAMSTLPTF